jgi:hypothetical protein
VTWTHRLDFGRHCPEVCKKNENLKLRKQLKNKMRERYGFKDNINLIVTVGQII